MSAPQLSRRWFLIGGSAAMAAVACGSGGENGALSSPEPVTGGARSSAAEIVTASFEHMVGDDRVAFAIFRDRRPIFFREGVTGTITVTKPDESTVGPLDLRQFSIARGVGGDGEHIGEPDMVFVADFPMDQGGFYELDAKVDLGEETIDLQHKLGVVGAVTDEQREKLTLRVGDKAISVPTPTTADARGVNPICTRVPPCGQHEHSLDTLLAAGTPVVLSFGTPAFCTSRMCGPVLDRIEAVRAQYDGPARFVHVEIYADNENISPDNTTEPFRAWRLNAEPYTFFIDSAGIIQARLSGPLGEFEVEERLAKISG